MQNMVYMDVYMDVRMVKKKYNIKWSLSQIKVIFTYIHVEFKCQLLQNFKLPCKTTGHTFLHSHI